MDGLEVVMVLYGLYTQLKAEQVRNAQTRASSITQLAPQLNKDTKGESK